MRATDQARLAVFGTLWPCAMLFHQVAYERLTASIPDIALVAAACIALLAPRSPKALAAAGLCLAAAVVNFMPMHFHHWYLAGWTGMIVAVGAIAISIRPANRTWESWVFAPLRWSVIFVYLGAAFHKLNSDYFSAATACGPHLAGKILARFGLEPPEWIATGAAPLGFAAFGAEVAVPLLLLGRRTRGIGLALGATLHLCFAIAGYPRFSLLMLALLSSLFLPDSLVGNGARLALGGPVRWAARIVSGWVVLAAIASLGGGSVEWFLSRTAHLGFFALTAASAAVLFFASIRTGLGPQPALNLRLAPPMALVPALIVLSIVAPYLGLGTRQSFSMYSNLRTEGSVSNHFLVSESAQIFPFQRDTVFVVSAEHPRLREFAGFQVPELGLRSVVDSVRRLGEDPGLQFEREGRVYDDSQLQPTSWFVRKFLAFRPIDLDGPPPCGP